MSTRDTHTCIGKHGTRTYTYDTHTQRKCRFRAESIVSKTRVLAIVRALDSCRKDDETCAFPESEAYIFPFDTRICEPNRQFVPVDVGAVELRDCLRTNTTTRTRHSVCAPHIDCKKGWPLKVSTGFSRHLSGFVKQPRHQAPRDPF